MFVNIIQFSVLYTVYCTVHSYMYSSVQFTVQCTVHNKLNCTQFSANYTAKCTFHSSVYSIQQVLPYPVQCSTQLRSTVYGTEYSSHFYNIYFKKIYFQTENGDRRSAGNICEYVG